jgi:hypothetical protein
MLLYVYTACRRSAVEIFDAEDLGVPSRRPHLGGFEQDVSGHVFVSSRITTEVRPTTVSGSAVHPVVQSERQWRVRYTGISALWTCVTSSAQTSTIRPLGFRMLRSG